MLAKTPNERLIAIRAAVVWERHACRLHHVGFVQVAGRRRPKGVHTGGCSRLT